jgi:hypothetical protein
MGGGEGTESPVVEPAVVIAEPVQRRRIGVALTPSPPTAETKWPAPIADAGRYVVSVAGRRWRAPRTRGTAVPTPDRRTRGDQLDCNRGRHHRAQHGVGVCPGCCSTLPMDRAVTTPAGTSIPAQAVTGSNDSSFPNRECFRRKR